MEDTLLVNIIIQSLQDGPKMKDCDCHPLLITLCLGLEFIIMSEMLETRYKEQSSFIQFPLGFLEKNKDLAGVKGLIHQVLEPMFLQAILDMLL